MTKYLLALLLIPTLNCAKSKTGIQADFKFCQFSVKKKKKKLILSCKPLKIRDANSTNWIKECNNVAYNMLNNEYYQSILKDKEVEEEPFGRISYDAARGMGTTMLKNSIRKTFKIISQ